MGTFFCLHAVDGPPMLSRTEAHVFRFVSVLMQATRLDPVNAQRFIGRGFQRERFAEFFECVRVYIPSLLESLDGTFEELISARKPPPPPAVCCGAPRHGATLHPSSLSSRQQRRDRNKLESSPCLSMDILLSFPLL